MKRIEGEASNDRNRRKMKIKILKSLLNIAPVILFAVALMQLYRANMELKYNYESLEWRMKNKNEQLDLINAALWRRSQFSIAHGADSSKVTQ